MTGFNLNHFPKMGKFRYNKFNPWVYMPLNMNLIIIVVLSLSFLLPSKIAGIAHH